MVGSRRRLKIADMRNRIAAPPRVKATTTDIAVAAQYSASAESLLFKFRIANFMQFGADSPHPARAARDLDSADVADNSVDGQLHGRRGGAP